MLIRKIGSLIGSLATAIACSGGMALWPHTVSAQEARGPNIILILTDDLGWTSLSSPSDPSIPASRSDYHLTPNLNKLAARGMRFSRGYASDPICSPSRRSLQFGQTSIRQGEDEFVRAYAGGGARNPSIPEALKRIDKRYRAAHFGKWDLRANLAPSELGYDVSDGDTGNAEGNAFQDKDDKWLKKYLLENPKQMDSLTSRAIRFMGNNTQTPFYLQVSHYATHLNFETKPKTFTEFERRPSGSVHSNAAWAGMLHDLDACIGRLIHALDSLGLTENTYVFFTSDNGGVEFIPVVTNRLAHPSTFTVPMRNSPLRGGKWTLYEGGIRVPFFVAGPGIQNETYSDVPVVGWDLLPTFQELAGGALQEADQLDGGSFASVLRNRGKGRVVRQSENFYFHRFHNGYPHSAMIRGDYKLIHFWKTNTSELYNLREDVGEMLDISDGYPHIVAEMKEELFTYLRQNNLSLTQQYLSTKP
jgi:arylsulfatase A